MSENPYASPTYIPGDKFAPQFHHNPHVYKPLPGLLLTIKVLAILTTVTSAVVTTLELISRAMSDVLAPEEFDITMTSVASVWQFLAIAAVPLVIGWNILYLVATYRLTANSHALGNPRPETSPGFAAGSYFIPILNLFKPYQAMKECYTACRVDGGSLLGFWWAAHIIGFMLGQISSRLTIQSLRTDSAQTAAGMQLIAFGADLLGEPVLIALAITSQLVLSRLASAQDAIASGKPLETGWTPAMIPPPKPLSSWGGD